MDRELAIKLMAALQAGALSTTAEADLDAVASLADCIGDQDERGEFRTHLEKVSTLYRQIMDAVAQGRLPELDRRKA